MPPNRFGERYDALDPRWHEFLAACGVIGVPLVNIPERAVAVARSLNLAGVLLTGGEDLARYGGCSPLRDETERALLRWAGSHGRTVLGVCRGMQLILDAHGTELVPVEGHVAVEHPALIDGEPHRINCYHRWAARDVGAPLVATGLAGRVVEAVRHPDQPIHGVMWHPERRAATDPHRDRDVAMVARLFAGNAR
ncbi:gamma-glutamyl-gamma-aminobutyrate hydrolase family protein [Dactylosporangium sp. CA-139066]